MANTKTTTKVSTKPKTTKAKVEPKEEKIAPVENKAAPKEEKIVPKEIDPSQYVIVRNGFQGRLIYKSPRTNEKFTWESFGDEQEIELRELRNAKGSCKKMFENNWFMFNEEDDWIIDYLGVRQYYKSSLNIDNFDKIFKMSIEEAEKVISSMSEGLKRSVSYRARQLILDGEIDSRKFIQMLEETLGTELIEK